MILKDNFFLIKLNQKMRRKKCIWLKLFGSDPTIFSSIFHTLNQSWSSDYFTYSRAFFVLSLLLRALLCQVMHFVVAVAAATGAGALHSKYFGNVVHTKEN